MWHWPWVQVVGKDGKSNKKATIANWTNDKFYVVTKYFIKVSNLYIWIK